MPKVSIIVPCYKAVRYLEITVRSVKEQTLEDWELILVDDGSPDQTFELTRRLAAEDSRIRTFQQTNGGQSKARNHGARMASPDSKYFYFLDADDLIHRDALALMVGDLERHPTAGVVTSEKSDIDGEGNALPPNPVRRWGPNSIGLPRRLPPTADTTPFVTYFCGTAGGLWALYRSSRFEEVGGWDESLRAFEDCDLLARIALVSEARHLPVVLNYYRKHATQNTAGSDFIGSNYVRFRKKWDAYTARSREEARRVAAARRFHYLIHEPGRHFRIAFGLTPQLIRRPSRIGFWWFKTNAVAGLAALWGGVSKAGFRLDEKHSAEASPPKTI